jgi:hypothetical protein
MKQQKTARRAKPVTRMASPPPRKPLPIETARIVVSLVARQFVTREITERAAYNHVADYGVMAATQLEDFFKSEVARFGPSGGPQKFAGKRMLWGKHCRGPGCDDFNEQHPTCGCPCAACKPPAPLCDTCHGIGFWCGQPCCKAHECKRCKGTGIAHLESVAVQP